MSNKAFRTDVERKVSSPENLKTYIKVTSPGLWAVVVAVIVLFAGIFLSGMDYTVRGAAIADNKKIELVFNINDLDMLEKGLPVLGLGTSYELPYWGEQLTVTSAKILSDQVKTAGDFSDKDWVCYMTEDIDIPDGIYPITIHIENTALIAGLFTHGK